MRTGGGSTRLQKKKKAEKEHMRVFFDPTKVAAPIDASLGAMGSLLGKLCMLLAPGCRLPKGVMDGMRLLKDDLEELCVCLEDLSEVEDPPLTAKCWMKEARELTYDIEDYTDRFVLNAIANIKTTRFVCKISNVQIPRLPKRSKQHNQMVDIISEFRMYVKEAIDQYERYGLDSCSTFRRRFVSVGPVLPMLYEPTADIVIDGRTSEFISLLASDADQQLKVVSVLGSGCLGKTTLAKVFYEKFAGQFECRAFIRVCKKPDTKRLFRDLLSQVQWPQPPDDCNELDITDNIRKHLKDKRYLIIIDDLWASSVWDIIKYAFPKGDCGSRVITTTQIEEVALACCCYHSEYVFEMKPLDDYHSRKLFLNRLFGSESNCPEEFKEISNKIVELCGGLPLATISTASLLARQPVLSIDLLTYVRNSLSSCLSADSTSERMRHILNLSYNNLPCHLKTCLLYLTMYPEGYTICKEDLVKQWMAEGFIHTIEGQDMEKVARSYFNELIDRRFIQPICISYNNEVLSCTVHDEVHDHIADKSAEENFIVVIDYNRKNLALSHKVRRLSILFVDAKYAKIPENITTSRVRSLTFFGLFKCMPCITEFKLLRVLNLQLSGHHRHDTINLTGISKLIHLRYLKIACDVCIQLPNHMRVLQCLETLDVMNTRGVTAVPHDIMDLPHLLHLTFPVETNLLGWLGRNIVSLWSLGKLNDLQDIHLACSSTPPSGHLEALTSLLAGHGNLKTLALVPGPSDKNHVVHGASKVIVSWDGFVPPPLLQRFECSLHICIFYRIPKWIEQLGNLCSLEIAVSKLLMNGVYILRGLPALAALSLYVQTSPVERIIFERGGFSVLNYFKFRCTTVPCLTFQMGAMPNLQKLNLSFNVILRMDQRQHGTVPIRIKHLPGLKEISVEVRGTGADLDSTVMTAISNHPSNPRINVQLVDYSFYGDESTTQKQQPDEILGEGPDEILEEEPDEYDKRFEKPANKSIPRSMESSSCLYVPGGPREKKNIRDPSNAPNPDTLVRHQFQGASPHSELIQEDHNTRLIDPETKELYLSSRTQEEEILLLRNKNADASCKQSKIPVFGDWENSVDAPYTQKFEGARKNKKTGIYSNPNDQGRHPEPPRKSPINPSTYTPDPRDQGPRNPPHGRRPETDPHRRESAPRRHANPQREQGGNAGAPRSPYRAAAGSASPMQLHNPSQQKQRSAGMHTPERRISSEGQGQHTPGRGRIRQGGRGYNDEEEVAVIPFGEWDEGNAASDENYAGIFNKVRADRLSPNSSARLPSSANRRQDNKVQQTCPCCIL